MSRMGTLFQFEFKKIIRRKIVWISTAIAIAVILLTVGGTMLDFLFMEGESDETMYQAFLVDKAYQEALDGRPVDQELLEEMVAAYSKLPADVERYSDTEEYRNYARAYSAIFNLVRIMTGMSSAETRQWAADEADLYAGRQAEIERLAASCFLSREELEFWKAQEAKMEWPMVFRYKEGYWRLCDCVYTIGLLAIVMAAVCLSGAFVEEHARKTDQLILSSRYGRGTVYWAKFLAGMSFALLQSVLFAAAAFMTAFAIYGSEGFGADFRLACGEVFPPLTIGGAVLISYGCMIAAVAVTAAFVMLLSEMLRSSVGTLSLVTGMVILSMFVNVPEHLRVLSQVWSYLPSEFVAEWNIFNPRTVPVFGGFLMSWQAAPLLYLVLGGGFAVLGKRVFVGYQVSGR